MEIGSGGWNNSVRRQLGSGLGLLASLLLIVCAGCHGSSSQIVALPPDTDIDPRQAFQTWAQDLVDVESFEETDRWQEDIEDRFRGVLRTLIVNASVGIRYKRDVEGYGVEETMTRLIAPGGTTKQAFRDATLGRVFGEGLHPAGTQENIEVSIVFETAEGRWRFLAVDHPLTLNCPRGIR